MRFFAIGGLSYLFSLMLAGFIPDYYLLSFFCIFIFLFSFISCILPISLFRLREAEGFALENGQNRKYDSNFKRFLVLFVLKCREKIKQITVFCAFGIAAVVVSVVNYRLNILPVTNLDGENLVVTGNIVELPHKDKSGGYHYVFKVKYIHGRENPKNFKLNLFSASPIEADIYDEFTGNVNVFLHYDTPEFPARSFYRAKSIYAGAFLYDHKPTEIKLSSGVRPLYYYALRLRERMLVAINSLFPENQAAVVAGILLGSKDKLPLNIKSDFDRIGVYYLFAVSGLHVTILTSIFLLVLKKVKVSKQKSSLIAAFLVLIFMFVACLTPSVVRAGVMCIVYLLGAIFFRRADSINSLGFAAFIISLFNPDAGGDIGLWLSLSAALGILLIVPKLKNYFFNTENNANKKQNIILSYIVDSVLVTFSATVFTFPLIAIYFKKISTISMLSNIMLIFPVTVILFLSVPLIFMYILNMPIFLIIPIKIACGIAINYTISCAAILSGFSFATVYLEKNITILWLICMSVLIGCFYFAKKHKNLKYFKKDFSGFIVLLMGFTCSFLLLFIFHRLFMKNLVRISVINSGKGCCLLCKKVDYTALVLCLGDGNQGYKVLSYLYGNGIKNIDSLILVGPKSGLSESLMAVNQIAQTYRPNSIVVNSEKPEISDMGSYMDEKAKFIDKDFHIEIFKGLNLYYKKTEETKLIFLNVSGKKILVCPFGGVAEAIPKAWSSCDVFIAGGIPRDYNIISSLHTILSMTKRDSDIVIPKIKAVGRDLLSTAEMGTIKIDISKFGALNVKARS